MPAEHLDRRKSLAEALKTNRCGAAFTYHLVNRRKKNAFAVLSHANQEQGFFEAFFYKAPADVFLNHCSNLAPAGHPEHKLLPSRARCMWIKVERQTDGRK